MIVAAPTRPQPNPSLSARRFPDDATAEAWFIERRWPEGVTCPHCGSCNVQTGAKHKTMPYRCRACRKRFSVKTGTVMQSSKLGYQTWALAGYLMTTGLKGQASMKLHRDLGITQKTAWHLAHRIRETWAHENGLLSGAVEADETHIGGKRKNMPKAKRKTLEGRGAVGKATVAGVIERGTGRVQAAKVEATDAATLRGFVRERVESGATLYTDKAAAYHGMREYRHEAINHSVGEYVHDMAHKADSISVKENMLRMAKAGSLAHIAIFPTERVLYVIKISMPFVGCGRFTSQLFITRE